MQPNIRPFAALLRVIDNPAQDIPLAAVLLSPLFPYTPDDLVALRRACPQGSLYGAVLYGGQPRFAAFTEALAEYRRLARTLPVDRLLEELLARTGYLAAVGALRDGARCREDLLTLWPGPVVPAGRGLAALVRAMDSAAANGGLNQSGGGQTRPGCVSIMTVHRSKGLEFPVVFVANTAHQFNQSDAIRPVLTHSRQGVGVMLRAGQTARRYKTLPLRGAGPGHPHRDPQRGVAGALRGADPCPGRPHRDDPSQKDRQFPQDAGSVRGCRSHRPGGYAGNEQLGGLAADGGPAPSRE